MNMLDCVKTYKNGSYMRGGGFEQTNGKEERKERIVCVV